MNKKQLRVIIAMGILEILIFYIQTFHVALLCDNFFQCYRDILPGAIIILVIGSFSIYIFRDRKNKES